MKKSFLGETLTKMLTSFRESIRTLFRQKNTKIEVLSGIFFGKNRYFWIFQDFWGIPGNFLGFFRIFWDFSGLSLDFLGFFGISGDYLGVSD